MKICKIFGFIIVFVMIFIIAYYYQKKEDIYIYFEDLKGYTFEYSIPGDTLKSTKILVKHEEKLSYQYWELNVDTSKIKKISPSGLQEILINSQYIIINNFGGNGIKNHLLNKYSIHVICQKGNMYYILPVTNLSYVME